jgi:hypothetical protein
LRNLEHHWRPVRWTGSGRHHFSSGWASKSFWLFKNQL